MRIAPVLLAAAALTLAGAASAQTLETVSYSPACQTALESDIGVREGEYLRTHVSRAIDNAIARRNVPASGVVIDVIIEDARPNRFTMQQLRARPDLDAMRSVSVGGAELRAVLRGPDGAVLTEVEHRRYTNSLRDLFFEPMTWTDATRTIRQFAEKVADAYVRNRAPANSGRPRRSRLSPSSPARSGAIIFQPLLKAPRAQIARGAIGSHSPRHGAGCDRPRSRCDCAR